MKSEITLIIFSFLCALTMKAQIKTDTIKPFSIGETRVIKSSVLNENRTLNIYLPFNYNMEKTYPVIYLLDGASNEDFLHIVGLVQFFNMQVKMPDFIIVGIANVDRKRDFTFHTDIKSLKNEFPTTGGSEKFINFIENELQPYIDSTYKTNDTKYIIGQSLGGLLASEILLKKPHLFTHYLIVSPSLWWDDESLLKQTQQLLDKQNETGCYIYISVGGQEEKIMQKKVKKFSMILQKEKKLNMKVEFLLLPKENHSTILHQSIYEGFKKLHPYKE